MYVNLLHVASKQEAIPLCEENNAPKSYNGDKQTKLSQETLPTPNTSSLTKTQLESLTKIDPLSSSFTKPLGFLTKRRRNKDLPKPTKEEQPKNHEDLTKNPNFI